MITAALAGSRDARYTVIVGRTTFRTATNLPKRAGAKASRCVARSEPGATLGQIGSSGCVSAANPLGASHEDALASTAAINVPRTLRARCAVNVARIKLSPYLPDPTMSGVGFAGIQYDHATLELASTPALRHRSDGLL